MVGGTTPPQSDSGEISRVLVLNLLWQSKRCSRTAQDISVLTTPSLLSRGSLNCGGLKNTATQGGPARPQHASQINNTALDEFGQALHTAADRTSPAHTDANGDPRDWNGIPVTPGQVAAVQEHEAEEANPTPEQFGGAVVAAQQAFKNNFGQAAFQDATTMPTPTLNSTHSLSQELDETVQRVEQ